MTVKELLREGRAKIEDPEHWCQDTLARDKSGNPISPSLEGAYAFCALGAIYRDPEHPERLLATKAAYLLDKCATEMGWEPDPALSPKVATAYLNDMGAHKSVLKAYDCAISKAD